MSKKQPSSARASQSAPARSGRTPVVSAGGRSSADIGGAAAAAGASGAASRRHRLGWVIGVIAVAAAGGWAWLRWGAGPSELPAAQFIAQLPQSDTDRWLIPTVGAIDPNTSADLVQYCQDIDVHKYLGTTTQKRMKLRLDGLREAMARRPSPVVAYDVMAMGYALGMDHASHGDYAQALTVFEAALAVAEGGVTPPEPKKTAAGKPAVDPVTGSKIRLQIAATYLRMGESANCAQGSSPYLCLLTSSKEGAYAQTEEVRRAITTLESSLKRYPGDANSRWLLNVGYMLLGGYPEGVPKQWLIPPERFASRHELPRFPNIARRLDLATVSVLGGSLIEDLDEDGFLDIVTTVFDPCQHINYFRNNGQGGFEDATAAAGLMGQLGGFNIQQTDYNNDGHVDLFMTRGGWQGDSGRMRPSLLQGDGKGHFSDVTHAAGLDRAVYPTQATAWADYDLDGDLDLYVGNEVGDNQVPYPSQLYRNNGDDTFTDVADAAGVVNNSMTKGVAWGDYDNDGDPDLYVSCIGPNRLFRNNGDGTFTDVAPQLGVSEPSGRSFVTWFWDYDNDGWLDLLVFGYGASMADVVRDYIGETPSSDFRPRLYRNNGHGGFEDRTSAAGLDIVRLPMGANFADVDNDGWLDFYIGTGNPALSTLMPNELYWNDHGKGFLNATASADVGHLPKGHGVAFGDLDNDGDQELLVQAGGFGRGDASPNALFLNPGFANHFVVLKLRGKTANRSAIGARLRLTVKDGANGTRDIHTVLDSGGGFGANSLQAEIGIGPATVVGELQVKWPAGPTETWKGLPADSFYLVEEGATAVTPLERRRVPLAGD